MLLAYLKRLRSTKVMPKIANGTPFINWSRIEQFIGFGRLDARIVFVGMEEGLKRANMLLQDLKVRSTYETPVMDLKEACREDADGLRYFDPNHAPRQSTWRVMADLMLRKEEKVPDTDSRRRYRALRLGRSDGDTLLAELLPYPHPKNENWLYKGFERYDTRKDYEDAMLPRRKRLLRSVLESEQRDLIICYGKKYWKHYEELFSDVRWHADGPHRFGQRGGSRIFLTTHLSCKDFNTDEQLADFARVVLNKRRA
jgi:hypothetical protein